MSIENEELAAELAQHDAVDQARRSADQVTATIEAFDQVDKVLNEDIAAIVLKIEANHKKKLKAQSRRRMLRDLANKIEAERDAE
jgi:acyl-CoA reductase-like NAD-dependent aldehyde dehydrogenase